MNTHLQEKLSSNKIQTLTFRSTVQWNIPKTPMATWVYFCDLNWLVMKAMWPLLKNSKTMINCRNISWWLNDSMYRSGPCYLHLVTLVVKWLYPFYLFYFISFLWTWKIYLKLFPESIYSKLTISLCTSSPYMNIRQFVPQNKLNWVPLAISYETLTK